MKTQKQTKKLPPKRMAARKPKAPAGAKPAEETNPKALALRKAGDATPAEPAVMPKGYAFTASDKAPQLIMREHLEFYENGRGAKVKDTMTLAELIPAIDYQRFVAENAAFVVGDLMIFGRKKFGPQLDWAMEVTGRNRKTVVNYERTCELFPPEKRTVPLTFSYYQRAAGVASRVNVEEAVKVLKDAQGTKKTGALTAAELSKVISEKYPKKKSETKNAARSEGRRRKAGVKAAKPKKEIEYYSPTPQEMASVDDLFDKLAEVNHILGKRVTERGKDWGDMYVTMDIPARKGLCSALELAQKLFLRVSFKIGY